MNEIKDLLSSYLPSFKAYIPDFILSGMDKLQEASGYGFLIAIILVLPFLRTFTYTLRTVTYTLIQPVGTITNSLAGVLALSIRTFFQMFSTISIATTNITVSWINAINNFLLNRSNYIILVISMLCTALFTCFYLEQRIDLYVILISFGTTSLLYAFYKFKLANSYSRQSLKYIARNL